jgi:hypothetical protein
MDFLLDIKKFSSDIFTILTLFTWGKEMGIGRENRVGK